jgi:hypothetical protein
VRGGEVRADLEDHDQHRVDREQDSEERRRESEIAHQIERHRADVLKESGGTNTLATRKPIIRRSRSTLGRAIRAGAALRAGHGLTPAASVAPQPSGTETRIKPAASELAPSTQKIAWNECAAMNRRRGGPTLMPRLMASRRDRVRRLRWAAGTSSVTIAMLAAGRLRTRWRR